jgi:hypothetical protein
MRGLCWLICSASIVGSVIAGPAFSAREFPADARHALFNVQGQSITYRKEPVVLSASLQIRDQSNMIVQLPALAGEYRVLYTLDSNGAVYRIWILTPEEQALYGPKHWFQRW